VVTLAPIRWRSDLARYRNNWRRQLVPLWNMVVNLRDGDRVLATLAGAAGNVALFLPLGFLLPMLASASTASGEPWPPASSSRP
jgi:glycopeptide antibiotics resistance protein